MLYGPPIQLLYRAHRSGQRVGMGVHSPRFWVSLVMDKRRIVHAAGVPDLLDGLDVPADDLNGVMAHDLEVAIRRGLPANEVMEAAERGLGRFFAALIEDTEVSAHLDPDPEVPKGSFPLPHSAVHMLAAALPTARPAERVSTLYHPDRDRLVVARVPDDSYLIELDPISLRTLRLVRQPIALGDLAARSGRNQAQRTEHFWRVFDLLVQLGLLEILRSGQSKRRFVSSEEGGWERGVSRPPSLSSTPRRRLPEGEESELERLERAVARLAEGPDAGEAPEETPPKLSSPPHSPAPSRQDAAPHTSLVSQDLGALDPGDEGPLAMFADDEEELNSIAELGSVAELEILDDDSEVDDENELLEFSFGDAGPDEASVDLTVDEEDRAGVTIEFLFDAEDPDEASVDLSFGGPEVASPAVIKGGAVLLSAGDLSSPERLLKAVESAAGQLRAVSGEGSEGAASELEADEITQQDGPHLEIIFEEDDEDEETWTGPLVGAEEADEADETEDTGDAVSEIGPSAVEVLEGVVAEPAAASPVSSEEALEVATLCAEFNPLAVLRLGLDQLDGVLTLAGLQRAFERERERYQPELYEGYPQDAYEAVEALDEILRASREAMRDPAIVAMWIRALRAFAEERAPLDATAVRQARQHFEAAQKHAFARDWRGASLAVSEALRLWPGQPRIRLLQIFCEVATHRITPIDGVLNIDSMWLTDPAEQALAQVTAGRLLKAAGRAAAAVARFRAALKLDPKREDARRELAASQQ